MLPIRIRFKKEGRAKYISHLDLNRVMQRALRRAQIPVWRTQGFNPHPYIVFAMPLSLFYESDCEVMDARLDGEMPLEAARERLAAQMPEGIVVTAVEPPEKKLTEIAFARYSVGLSFAGKTARELDAMLGKMLGREELYFEKVTKRHTVEIDVRDYFEQAERTTRDGAVEICATVPAGPLENLNPAFFADVFERYAVRPDLESIRRVRILDESGNDFR